MPQSRLQVVLRLKLIVILYKCSHDTWNHTSIYIHNSQCQWLFTLHCNSWFIEVLSVVVVHISCVYQTLHFRFVQNSQIRSYFPYIDLFDSTVNTKVNQIAHKHFTLRNQFPSISPFILQWLEEFVNFELLCHLTKTLHNYLYRIVVYHF